MSCWLPGRGSPPPSGLESLLRWASAQEPVLVLLLVLPMVLVLRLLQMPEVCIEYASE